jgi:hypothetical protein
MLLKKKGAKTALIESLKGQQAARKKQSTAVEKDRCLL